MLIKNIRLAPVLLLAAVLTIPVYGAGKKEIDSAKGRLTALEEEKKKTDLAIQELHALKSNTETYVKALDSNLNVLNNELDQLAICIMDKESAIGQTKIKLAVAKEAELKQYEAMKLRIKYMYEQNEPSLLELLVQSHSLSELLNHSEYVRQISAYDRKMMNRYVGLKEEIEAVEKTLETEHTELLGYQEQTQAKQASIESLIEEKSTELIRFNQQLSSKTAKATAYEKDIRAQEDAIRRIEAEIKRQEEEARKKAASSGQKYNPVSIGNIKFIWPCPASSRVTSSFGDRESPTEGASSNHKGMDIGAPAGSNILAASSGTVTVSTYSYSAGNYIMINHGGGVSTVYMHCSQLLVSEGESVSQGQIIGKVGSTGYSTGPHLHFGVRVNGSYVNPAKHVSP